MATTALDKTLGLPAAVLSDYFFFYGKTGNIGISRNFQIGEIGAEIGANIINFIQAAHKNKAMPPKVPKLLVRDESRIHAIQPD